MANNTIQLQITGTATEFGDSVELDSFRFSNGKGFPESYKKFVRQYGYGLALGQFHIYLPMSGYGDCLLRRSAEIQGTYMDDVLHDDIWFELEPDGSPELLIRLFPFACSDNGYYLFWDPASCSDEELDIYLTDFRGSGFIKAGQSLFELIENMTTTGYRYILPFTTQPLPRTFKYLQRI